MGTRTSMALAESDVLVHETISDVVDEVPIDEGMTMKITAILTTSQSWQAQLIVPIFALPMGPYSRSVASSCSMFRLLLSLTYNWLCAGLRLSIPIWKRIRVLQHLSRRRLSNLLRSIHWRVVLHSWSIRIVSWSNYMPLSSSINSKNVLLDWG